MTTKACTGCGEQKDLEAFSLKADTKDGRNTQCKACRLRYMQLHYTKTVGRSRPILPDGQKFCTRCRRVLPVEAFGPNVARKDGRQVYCRDCWKAPKEEFLGNRTGLIPPEGHKRCPVCKRVLPLDEFWSNAGREDGRQVYCKACWAEYTKYRMSQTPSGRFRKIRRVVERNRRDPQKHRASLYVSCAVYFGDLQKQPCEKCGATKTEAHHDDYSKPLEVRWLCKTHHAEADLARRTNGSPLTE